MTVSRRNFLTGAAAGAAGTALAGGVLAGGARADARAATGAGPAQAQERLVRPGPARLTGQA